MRRYLPVLALCFAGLRRLRRHPGKTIEYSLSIDPPSLDPALSTDVQSGEVAALLFDNLVQFDVDGQIRPGLAAHWEVDSSGAVYTFHLRPGPLFHDGRPDPGGGRPSLDRPGTRPGLARGPPVAPDADQGRPRVCRGEAKHLAGIATPDDSTVVFTLEEPLNIFLQFLAMPVAAVVPVARARRLRSAARSAAGRGSFVSWAHDDALDVRAEPEQYWGGAPAMDSLRIRIIPEPLDPSGRIRGRPAKRGGDPVQRDPALGAGPARRVAAPAGHPRPLRRHQHDPWPLARRRGCGEP